MSASRTQRLGAAGLTVTVGLLLVLAVQVGLTAAANDTSGASSSGALQGSVIIDVKGKRLGPGKGDRGRFTISGAISDRGRFVDRDGGINNLHRTLFGAKGTIWIKVGGAACQCNWRITKGTKTYAGLRGRGRESGLYADTIEITMEGTVSK
jgi:hypothetical protein